MSSTDLGGCGGRLTAVHDEAGRDNGNPAGGSCREDEGGGVSWGPGRECCGPARSLAENEDEGDMAEGAAALADEMVVVAAAAAATGPSRASRRGSEMAWGL
jgi:hypothetical protein